MHDGLPATLVVDSAAALVIAAGREDAVLTGVPPGVASLVKSKSD